MIAFRKSLPRIKARHVARAKPAHVHRVLEYERHEPGPTLHGERRIEPSDANSIEKGSLSKLDMDLLPKQPREHDWDALHAPFVDQEGCLDFELGLHARVCIHVATLRVWRQELTKGLGDIDSDRGSLAMI